MENLLAQSKDVLANGKRTIALLITTDSYRGLTIECWEQRLIQWILGSNKEFQGSMSFRVFPFLFCFNFICFFLLLFFVLFSLCFRILGVFSILYFLSFLCHLSHFNYIFIRFFSRSLKSAQDSLFSNEFYSISNNFSPIFRSLTLISSFSLFIFHFSDFFTYLKRIFHIILSSFF